MSEKKDYKATLQLPQTEFPMRAGLPTREPEQVERWEKARIYDRMIERNKAAKKPRFVLHDGPPYANGGIHMGHALNKVLKDIIVKYKNLAGFESPYIPGWDCHGLPIELGVEKQLLEQKRDKSSVPVSELRSLCRAYAQTYIDLQKKQFQRLEIFGDWDHPYRTMSDDYVASIVREVGKHAEEGILFKGNKPVYWCVKCETALAEAEIEYADKKSPSIYVKFDLTAESLAQFPELKKAASQECASRVSVVIWTTTPWTLPANLAVALHPEYEYVVIKAPSLEGTELWIVAQGLQETFEKAVGFQKTSTPVMTFKAEKLHRLKVQHPFISERQSLIILGEHVTLEAGTGAVHTAPGHGVDDFKIGAKYQLEVLAPVDDQGKYTSKFQKMQGQFVFKCNEPIIQMLTDSGNLVARSDVQHSYPHCWRCQTPIIFRATPQWFITMGDSGQSDRWLRKESIQAIRDVQWVPEWGINRILGMMESRPDWCVSRQRLWGVPITVFYCTSCGEAKADRATFEAIAARVEKEGVDFWFSEPADKSLPQGTRCKCGGTQFKKEKDILDVWFDSGVSHAAVCEPRGLGWPADLYLEGSDQHRGWFQTSLLTGVATRRRAPFKAVLTHGFVNDKDGKKMSKSKGNIISPLDLMKTHGAEILRLWVVLEDYRNDLSFSMESVERVSESYRKIRNTIRFILGNLFDFNPKTDLVPLPKLGELDAWALARAGSVLEKIRANYDAYEFHSVYHLLVNFCGVDLSAKYFDILKDRLYTAKKDSPERRSSQTVMWMIGEALTTAIAPILSFTAEEIWSFLPRYAGKAESVFFTDMITSEQASSWSKAFDDRYESMWIWREEALKALEAARAEKKIGHSREARVELGLPSDDFARFKRLKEDLSRIFLVSDVKVSESATLQAVVHPSQGLKCERCWTFATTTGKTPSHPDICHRCVEALS